MASSSFRHVPRRVTLASVYSHCGCTLKDVAGGFGTVFEVGSSQRARWLEQAKSRLADLPPVALGQIAARLHALGHVVRFAHVEGAPGELDRVAAQTDVVLLLTSLVDADAERHFLTAMRRRGVRTVAFGIAATASRRFSSSDADLILAGEPEGASDEAWREIIEGRPPGVLDVGSVRDLDTLPFPDWSPFPIERYRYALLSQRGPTLPIQSARGCPYACSYCPWRVTARFRERDPDRVAREARRDRDLYGAASLSFRDPLFNLSEERVRALARALAPLGLKWSAEMRADRLDPELIRELGRAGLRSLEIGVESVDRALLAREKRKPPTHAQIEEVVRTAQSAGVRVICNYVLGLPGDTRETIRETVRWAKELDSFAVQFTVATPYPGTSLEARVRGRTSELTGFRASELEDALPARELEELREWAYVSYYFRPRYALTFARRALPALLD